ncbi:MAG: DUF4919 domain-containing protein [Asticcacaulis sp.]
MKRILLAALACLAWAPMAAHADKADFFGTLDDDDRAAMFKAANSGDWAGALAAANKAEDATWFDGGAHFIAGLAQSHLGHADEGAREQAIADAIFASIKTGNGLTADTAFTVVAVSEEYDLLNLGLGDSVKSQALSMAGDHQFDVMTVTDENGKEITYYFNIDREWAAEGRMFSGLGN